MTATTKTHIANIRGRSVEIRQSGAYLQWRLEGTTDAWLNLLPLADIQGLPGVNAVENVDAIAGYVDAVVPNALQDALFAKLVAGAEVTPAYKGSTPENDPPISRAGSFAALSRWLRATQKRAVSASAALTIITDSTGTDTSAGDGTGWPTILAGMIADAYPNITVRLRRFEFTTTLRMLAPTVVQESPLGRPRYRVGVNPFYFLTAGYDVAGLQSAKALLDADDLDLRIKFDGKHSDLDAQTIELITNWGPTSDPADRGIEFYMGTTSTLSIRVSTSPTTWASFNSTIALPYTDDQPIWARAVLDRDNGAAGKTVTFYYSTDGQATWTQLGTPVTVAGVLSGVQDTPDWHWEIGTIRGGMSYTMIVTGAPTGGTYKLRWFPDNASTVPDTLYETAAIAFDADNATIQTAIRAVPHAALAGAVVTGGATKTITFTQPVRFAQAFPSLTGGTAPSVALGGAWFTRPFNVYEVEIRKGLDGPAVGPTQVWDWEVTPSRVSASGGPMLDIVNFAFSGRSVQNFLQQPYLDIAREHRGQLAMILATGHNEGQIVGAQFTALLDQFAEAVKARLPYAAIAVGTENPEVAPSVTADYQSARSAQIAAWAARGGMTVVDTFTAFLDDDRWDDATGGVLMSDDRHPSHAAHETIIAPMMMRAIETGA